VLIVSSIVMAGQCLAVPGPIVGPEAYGLVGRFGMASPVSTRALGMGGPISCLKDVPFANPSFASAQTTQAAGIRATRTDSDGVNTDSALLHYSHPVRPNESGFQLTVMNLDGDGTRVVPPVGPLMIEMKEDAWVVDYGRRLSDKFRAGLSILGRERIELDLSMPVVGSVVHLVAKANFGGRLGAAYEWAPGDYVGAVYSFTQHTVTPGGVTMMGMPQAVFHAFQFGLGASRHICAKTVAVAEFQRGVLRNGAFERVEDTWHFGAEYQASPQWALRAGITDSEPTFGVGYNGGRWQADYAFIRDWNHADAELLLGDSDTHSLQAIYRW
jgi:hypothetical protein